MTEEAAIGENQTAESAQAEQAAPKFFDVNEFLASQNLKAAESTLSEDEHIGVDAAPLVSKEELTMLLKEPTEQENVSAADASGLTSEHIEAQRDVLVAPCPLTLEQYLRLELNAVAAHTAIEYRVVARKNGAGDVTFYIHPFGQDGMSRDFAVMGELARNITKLTA